MMAKQPKKAISSKKPVDYRNVTLKDLQKALKTEDSVFSNWFYRPISLRITRYIIRYPITPTQITMVSLLFALISAVLFVFGNYWLSLWGVFFMHVAFLIDHNDGEVARFKNMKSLFGGWLDQVSDRIKEFTLFSGITLGLYTRTMDPMIIFIGMFAIINLLMVGYVRSTAWFAGLKKTSDVKIGKRTHLGFIDTVFFLVTLLALIDMLELILIFFATAGMLIWIYQMIVRYRWSKQLQ